VRDVLTFDEVSPRCKFCGRSGWTNMLRRTASCAGAPKRKCQHLPRKCPHPAIRRRDTVLREISPGSATRSISPRPAIPSNMVAVVHQSLEQHALLPSEHLVDKAYTDSDVLVDSKHNMASPSWAQSPTIQAGRPARTMG
jgi:hypothetical protein